MQNSDLTDDQIFTQGELLRAIESTLSFFDQMKKPSDQLRGMTENRLSYDKALLGARANRNFADFFIRIQERFNLDQNALNYLLDIIFEGSNMSEELDDVHQRNRFPRGVNAVVRSYMKIKRLAEESGDIITLADPIQDVENGIDMIQWSVEMKGGKQVRKIRRVYQIKGNSKVNKTDIIPVGKIKLDNKYIEYRNNIGIKNIEKFAEKNGVDAYLVIAPSRAVVN